MIEVIKAPLYRLCNCCGSNHHVIEIYFRSENIGVNQGTCVAICPDCFNKVQMAAITTLVRMVQEETDPPKEEEDE